MKLKILPLHQMHRIIILCILGLVSVAAHSQSKRHAFDSVFTYLFNNGQFNGNVLVAEKGKIIFEKSYGFADMSSKAELDSHSIFELASVSKQFTAMAILLLEKSGRITLDDSLSKYLPQLPYKGITIEHLLTHTSGLPDYMALFQKYWNKNEIAQNGHVVKLLTEHHPPSISKPGERYEYSNTGYVLLAAIIEIVTHQSFEAFLKNNIFRPLKMQQTRVYNTRRSGEKISNYAYGYVFDEAKGEYVLPDSVEATRLFITSMELLVMVQ